MNGAPASWPVPGGLPDGGHVIPDPPYHDGEPVAEPAMWITDEPVPGAKLGPIFARHLVGCQIWPFWWD